MFDQICHQNLDQKVPQLPITRPSPPVAPAASALEFEASHHHYREPIGRGPGTSRSALPAHSYWHHPVLPDQGVQSADDGYTRSIVGEIVDIMDCPLCLEATMAFADSGPRSRTTTWNHGDSDCVDTYMTMWTPNWNSLKASRAGRTSHFVDWTVNAPAPYLPQAF